MSRDGERVIELASELASRLGHLLTDMVPPPRIAPLPEPAGLATGAVIWRR